MEQVLTVATQAILSLVAALAVFEFLRHRDRPRLDIALMLSSLGLPLVLAAIGVNELRPVAVLSGMLIVAQPFLLLRLVDDFRPVPRPLMIAGAGGMVVAWILVVIFDSPLPPPATIGIVAYLVTLEGYATVSFAIGAKASRGVSRWRYGLAAAGSALLAMAFFLVAVVSALTGTTEGANTARGFLPVLTGIFYYLAFVSPGWLRQAWQLPEVRNFLRTVAGQPVKERADRLVLEVCSIATATTGGIASVIYLWDPGSGTLKARSSDAPALRSSSLGVDQAPILREVWKERRATFARNPDAMGPACKDIADKMGANALMAVPVSTPSRSWGVLVVVLRAGSLFPADDIALLEVLTEQCAIALGSAELVEEEQRRAEQQHQLAAQLEAANKELEAFAYSVSHDLRAPLRGIDGFSQALQKEFGDRLDAQGLHYLERVRANSQFMGRLIDGLLRLSRVTRSEMVMRPVDLSALAREVADALQQQEPKRKVCFQIRDGVTVLGDPGLLRIAMENLFTNAWKFTSKHRTATIEFGANGDGETPVYYIKDDGAGFDIEYVGKLFGPFQRLHVEEGFEGTGIGLATVHRIIARHGGQVWAEGAVEQGATFYFTIGSGR